ncbi:FAST kinase domain-containing protein 4 [Molothrus ater]|uniref:FAST kinase domain-containing protein 4 n=1 Tax=Molothrus ater TaxID=84834 RepID=UPI00174CE18F|nr:FAST kinase domain-containing protein 4 [Molothrus ater]XP_054373325.1 FAST kinase domain-containing protein 4 [Molothrus ater]
MAAHLVRRCFRRLLLLPAPPGPGAGPALRTGPARAAEEPRARARPEGEEQQLRELIREAGSAQELLQLGRGSALSSNLAALAIARLARLSTEQHLDTESLRGDPRFQQLLGTLDAQISQVWNSSLLQLLRVLPALGLARGGRQVRSVEQEVLWRLRRLPLRQLVQLAEQLAGQGHQGLLLPEVLRKLELRWTELEGTRTVVTLMAKVGHLSPALMERLEDKALELAEQFDPDELRRVALALALQQRRCVPLLRALSYHLLQKPAELPLPVLTDLLFAFSKLSFQQPQVLHRLALELQPHLGSLSPAQVLRCARSFSSLRWLSRPLAEAMAQYCLDNSQDLSITQLCGILVSFARLNFQPSSSEEFFSMIHERLQAQEQQLDVHLLTDVVWSLCVLQQPRGPHLSQVLSPEFQARLQGDSSPRAQSSRLKLLHINATARLEVLGYEGPFLSPELLGGHGDRDKDKEKATPLQRWLREALPGALGGPDLVRYNVSTVYGWDIDAEAVLDSDNKPLPVRDYTAPHLSHSEGTKPLPPGARRVAVLRWELPQFSSRGRELLGRGSMARRHLRAAGFLLAEVPHYEFLELKLERQRVAYLKDKVAKALASDTAGDTAT